MKQLHLDGKFISRHFWRKILSIVAAAVLWYIVVVNVYPDSTYTVTSVPVTINEKSGFLADAGLHVVDKSHESVKIKVYGSRSVIGRLKASDFNVTPNVSRVEKSGNYSLQLTASLKNADSRVAIQTITPSQIDISFDTVVSKSFPVTVNMQSSKIADGYVRENAVSNPQQITVSGPSAEVGQVAGVTADVQVNSDAKDTFKSKYPVSLCDSKGNKLDLKHVKVSNSQVAITVPILKTKQVQFSLSYSNIPAGFDSKNIQCTFSPSSLNIAGESQAIDSIAQIKLSAVDFQTLDISNTVDLPIPALNNVKNLDNVTTVKATINLLDTVSKTLSTNDLQVLNLPEGYDVLVRTRQINNIKLFGPASDMPNVNSVTAYVNMSATNISTGQYDVPVTVAVPGKSGFWATGNYSAVVKVTKK